MEEGLRRTALIRLTVEAHRPIGPRRPTVEALHLIDLRRPTVVALRLIDLHRLTEVVAPIVVAEAARLSLTVAAVVEVDLGAAIAAVAPADVRPPGDTEAVANQFLRQTKAPLANTSGALFCIHTCEG